MDNLFTLTVLDTQTLYTDNVVVIRLIILRILRSDSCCKKQKFGNKTLISSLGNVIAKKKGNNFHISDKMSERSRQVCIETNCIKVE